MLELEVVTETMRLCVEEEMSFLCWVLELKLIRVESRRTYMIRRPRAHLLGEETLEKHTRFPQKSWRIDCHTSTSISDGRLMVVRFWSLHTSQIFQQKTLKFP